MNVSLRAALAVLATAISSHAAAVDAAAPAASAPAAAADADDGLPWAWLGLGIIAVAGFGAFFFKRRRASRTVLKAGVRR